MARGIFYFWSQYYTFIKAYANIFHLQINFIHENHRKFLILGTTKKT